MDCKMKVETDLNEPTVKTQTDTVGSEVTDYIVNIETDTVDAKVEATPEHTVKIESRYTCIWFHRLRHDGAL